MTPKPKTPGDGNRGNTGDNTTGRSAQHHGGINAGNGFSSAYQSVTTVAQRGRPGGDSGNQPTNPSNADLHRDLDPAPRPGETPQQAADRADAAQSELDLRKATDTYHALGDEPPRLNLDQNDATHVRDGAHTVERHGPDVPLNRSDAPPGDRTIEGRIHGDPPWGRPENWSYRWSDGSTMNRTVNDYIQANWDTIRSDLALNGEHSATFDAGHRTGEGFYNEGMYGAGPRSAHYGQTSYATVRLRLIPGNPPSYFVVTAFPSGLP
ncbi:hypothetical protein [Kibdelosporangium phytohabitans]|uniref:Uncharacterized protein n=1 Tax=Kibdelosporangium phytohabitans TaxID=860235 RepID=A0A0N9I3T5_9PSEU|nr:hypothetical protein [Kibdelosporangium phytohabitans]ALG10331.1 hypothetical protein AOZ06_28620 [Kibdelosporangium phytohabitans]MBE1461373.1 hypothetical protein [Kibdelosporangium phytohabitans]